MTNTVIILVIALVCIIIGLLLSSSGSTGGLNNISAQELEIFKRTKDRGLIKILQFTLFILAVVLAILIVVFSVLKI